MRILWSVSCLNLGTPAIKCLPCLSAKSVAIFLAPYLTAELKPLGGTGHRLWASSSSQFWRGEERDVKRLGPFVPTRTLSDFHWWAIKLVSEMDVTSVKKSHFPITFFIPHILGERKFNRGPILPEESCALIMSRAH